MGREPSEGSIQALFLHHLFTHQLASKCTRGCLMISQARTLLLTLLVLSVASACQSAVPVSDSSWSSQSADPQQVAELLSYVPDVKDPSGDDAQSQWYEALNGLGCGNGTDAAEALIVSGPQGKQQAWLDVRRACQSGGEVELTFRLEYFEGHWTVRERLAWLPPPSGHPALSPVVLSADGKGFRQLGLRGYARKLIEEIRSQNAVAGISSKQVLSEDDDSITVTCSGHEVILSLVALDGALASDPSVSLADCPEVTAQVEVQLREHATFDLSASGYAFNVDSALPQYGENAFGLVPWMTALNTRLNPGQLAVQQASARPEIPIFEGYAFPTYVGEVQVVRLDTSTPMEGDFFLASPPSVSQFTASEDYSDEVVGGIRSYEGDVFALSYSEAVATDRRRVELEDWLDTWKQYISDHPQLELETEDSWLQRLKGDAESQGVSSAFVMWDLVGAGGQGVPFGVDVEAMLADGFFDGGGDSLVGGIPAIWIIIAGIVAAWLSVLTLILNNGFNPGASASYADYPNITFTSSSPHRGQSRPWDPADHEAAADELRRQMSEEATGECTLRFTVSQTAVSDLPGECDYKPPSNEITGNVTAGCDPDKWLSGPYAALFATPGMLVDQFFTKAKEFISGACYDHYDGRGLWETCQSHCLDNILVEFLGGG